MKKEQIVIPVALQLVLDDIGWFTGRDERESEQPSRTGMPRRHVLEDYIVVNEIGKAINMKINTMLVIGEWDRHNILRRVPHSNREGEQWDSAKFLDAVEAEKIRDFLNSCDYIELGVHGLLHDLWHEGKNVCGQEYFWPEGFVKKAPRTVAPEEYLRAHFDAFMEIYQDWGFNHKLRSFASPGGVGKALESGSLSYVLKDYGIQFWHNNMTKNPTFSTVQNGIIFHPKAIEICPWEAYDLDPDILPTYDPEKAGILGGHWVNLLRFNPKKNLERVDAWKAFFQRQAEVFGMILSRDVAFAHYQQLYRFHSKTEEVNGEIHIDLTEADAIRPGDYCPPLYISVKKGSEPTSCVGGILSVYEEREDFVNYKIERTAGSVVILR